MREVKNLTIVILAAGRGQRMQSLKPKVLQKIGGVSLLEHVVKSANSLNPDNVIVVYGAQGDEVKAHLSHYSITWVEQKMQLGTAHALLQALPLIPSHHRVLVLYGDVPLIKSHTLSKFIHETPVNLLGLLTTLVNNARGYGRIIRDANQQIIKIVEERDANAIEKNITEINTGIYLANAIYFATWLSQIKPHNAQLEYYLTDIIELAHQEKIEIQGHFLENSEEILGVNDRVQQADVERIYQKNCANQLMQQGVWIVDPARFDLRGELIAENDCKIDINVIFEGNNRLGKNVSIGPNCVLINCDIGDEVTLLANCYLEGVTIKTKATIGPFARIRPNTIVGENTRIGNFVEIKNTIIDSHSKISHLSYIGDARIGKEVNIGAGVITCNYDGANKHQTIIEDKVHIGADSQLVAPIRLGQAATIAAGSTVIQDVPPEKLTLTHQLMTRSKSWQRPQKKDISSNEIKD